MKKVYLLLTLISVSVFSQKRFDNIKSEKLGEERRITIGLPPSYEANPEKKYPVLYLLDGDYLFDPFSGAVSYGAYWDDLPEMIIIGVHQNKDSERYDDTTIDQINGLPFESRLVKSTDVLIINGLSFIHCFNLLTGGNLFEYLKGLFGAFAELNAPRTPLS